MTSIVIICCVLLATTMAEEDLNTIKLLHNGNVDFTTKFFQKVVKSEPDSSVVMSAYSVLTPLAQLSLAAEGASQKELLGALGLPNTDVVKEAFKAADKNIHFVQGVTLKTANRIYIGLGAKVKEEFNIVSKDVFDSEVKNVNFADSLVTAATINEWVERQTNNRIKDLVSPDALSADTRAVLVNAIYFKGKWSDPFSKVLTKNRDFYLTKDKKMDVPMMFQNNKYLYGYSKELKAQLLEIPYEKHEASFLIILPEDVDGISALQENLRNQTALTKANNEMTYEDVNVHLPRFQIETTIDLKDVLKHIGLENIFSPGKAQLNKLLESDESLYISYAIQKAYIEVNEEGAEAAAANAFGISLTSAIVQLSPPKEFNANHPFVFAIKVHNEIIFSGVLRK